MRNRLLVLIMTVMVLLSVEAAPAFAAEGSSDKPNPMAQAALLVDVKTGKVLYEKNKTKEMYPASLTKMMTCLVVLDHLKLDQKVTVAPEAVFPVGNNINLKAGEVLTVEELLNALMIYSSNDAALALAIETSGSVEAFAKEMNKKAKEIGCKHTNYINPNGFTNEPIHHTTAEDLVKIASYGLKNETFSSIVKKATYTVPKTNKNKARPVETTNLLLRNGKYHYDGVIGVKTGFMALSGYCFVGAAEKDGMTLIGVSLNSGDIERFTEVADMFDYGFDNFKTLELVKKNEKTDNVKVKYGHKTSVPTMVPDGAFITMPKSGDESLATTEVKLKDHVEAPIKKGTKVGTLEILEDGKKVDETEIVIAQDVEKGGPWTALYISDMTFYIMAGVAAVILLLIIIVAIKVRSVKKRRALERKREREEMAMRIAAERKDKEQRGWPF